MTWRDVDGWLSFGEGEALQSLAAGARVLEVGSYKGRSTVAMASAAKYLVSVDHHQGDSGTGPGDTLNGFLANLVRHGVRDKVTPVIADVATAAPLLSPRSFDLIFIDDDHDRCATTTGLVLPLLAPNGVIAWHDWDYPAVRAGATTWGLSPASFRDSLAWGRFS